MLMSVCLACWLSNAAINHEIACARGVMRYDVEILLPAAFDRCDYVL